MSGARTTVRVVAIAEAAKGLLVLLAGFGLLALIHHDLQHQAEQLIRHLHLDPASHYPRVFLEFTARLPETRLAPLAWGALAYVLLRLVEAYGLWHDRVWAEWLAAVSGAIYLPVEAFEVVTHVTWPKVTVLVVNLAVVLFMVARLRQRRSPGRT